MNNREEQFQLIPAIIEARRTALQHLQMDELAQMCFIQDSGAPQTVVESVSRADKKKLIDHIIEHMVHNHHPVTEERYQFVEWLYRIRAHHGNHYGFLRIHRLMIHFVTLLLMLSVACAVPVTSTLQ